MTHPTPPDTPFEGTAPPRRRLRVAFGPEAPGWGSWDWTGADVLRLLAPRFATSSFPAWEVPEADLVVLVKHAPPPGWVEAVTRHAPLLYGPVDRYGSAAEVDADAPWLRRCARVLIHCERLRRYLQPYAPVVYLDHHIKFAAPLRDARRDDGDLLWVGVRSNLPPLVDWVNAHGTPAPLVVLTNPEDPARVPPPAAFGFRPDRAVRLLAWSPRQQADLTARGTACSTSRGTTSGPATSPRPRGSTRSPRACRWP